MTEQKVLDNIQTRIEDLISERFSGAGIFNIDIQSSNYNPSLNSSITITITVTDQDNNPITNWNVPLKRNGTNISNISTNQNGIATYTYNCSTYGNHIFSVKTSNITIHVGNPYPVGSIYMSVNSTSPATIFGGTWVQLQDRFLLAAGSNYNNGDTGGEASVTLTADQSGIPAHGHGMAHTHNHNHNAIAYQLASASGTARRIPLGYNSTGGEGVLSTDYDNTASSKSSTDNNTASNASEAHNNMPPYLVVYMWKRTA